MSWRKPVEFRSRLGVNYLWHLLAAARVGYDSDYADRYRQSVDADAINVLERHGARIRFGNGETGSLTSLLAFLPGWLRLESHEALRGYLDTAEYCLECGSFAPLAAAFPDANWEDPWYLHLPGHRFQPAPAETLAFHEIAECYVRNFERYATAVWPVARAAMETRRLQLATWFARRDLIADWERYLSIPFLAPRYEIMLCYSNRGGPDYNSLGYDGNLFFYDKPFKQTCHFVSHEIGTHILGQVKKAVDDAGRHAPGIVYRAFEDMVMFLNERVLGVERLAYTLPPTFEHAAMLSFCAASYQDPFQLVTLLDRAADFLAKKAAHGRH
ncbi:MAG: hypothetical protein U0527_14425 [Candidatus Eisenbacteria bacterium]